MRKPKNILFLSGLIFISLIACNTSQKRGHNDLEKYLNKELNNDLETGGDIYIVFNLHSCSSCLQKTKRILDNNFTKKTDAIHLVIAGYSTKDINLYLGNLTQKFDIIYDKNRKLNDQSFFKPNNFYVFRFKNDQLMEHYFYNVGENLDRFEKMMIVLGRQLKN